MATSVSLCWISLLLCIYGAFAGGPEFDGDASGTNALVLFDGTPNTDKWLFGMTCTSTVDSAEIELRVYKNDRLNFSSYHAMEAGDQVRYETCTLLVGDEYDDNDAIVDVVDADCPGGAGFERLAPVNSNTAYASDTLWKKISITDYDNLPCGGTKGTGLDPVYCFYVHCSRDSKLNMAWDVIVKVCIENDTLQCTSDVVESDPINLPNGPTRNITRERKVSLETYAALSFEPVTEVYEPLGPTGEDVMGVEKVDPTNDVLPLGRAIFFEICLESLSSNFFTLNNLSTLGLQPYDCLFQPSAAGSAFKYPDDNITMSDSDNCGTESKMAPWAAQEHAFQFVTDPNFANELGQDKEYTPNCWRTKWTEVSVFRLNSLQSRGLITLTCSLRYCKDMNDEICYPTDNSICEGLYPTKKRDVSDDTDENLPDQVTTTFRIELGGATKEEQQDPCFEKNTFIALSSSLGVLLLVVLIVASYLAVRLWTDPDDELSRTTDSMTGYQNKQYSY